MNKKIIFSSGGTGGHIFPTINLMEYFSNKGYEVILVTDNKGNNFLKNYPKFKSYIITTDTPMKKNIVKQFFSLVKISYSILESIFILKKEKPNLIIGFGGYVSFPISFASKFFNFPLIVYENNLILGRANKYLLSTVKKLFVATAIPENLPEKYKSKVEKVGPILNKNIANYSYKKKSKNEIFSILVMGGSQGAEVFGKIVPSTIKMIKDKGFNLEIHQQCLENQKNSIEKFYEKNKIKNNVFVFESNILNLILSADLAISRCGASTTAELVHTCTPFIAVPYPYSLDNHQYLNAKYYEDKNYCWLLEENNFSSINLFNLIVKIINDKKKLENIRENMKKNYSGDTYKKIENSIKEIIKNEN
tara:strand:+ start:120 stop:1208 length:1089 start_codon:yes stop_codon:yes gene_type:complete